ncbi:MAG: lamin tail domain-containing protein, partial [Planctomycetota bacterium]
MRIPPSVLALVLCGATTSLGAQVVISEIHLSPATATEPQWIEIVNLGTAPQDLSNWSVYQATKTPNKPQNYWFAMPAKTVLPANTIMRIAWGAKITSTNPLDIETGDNVKNFLFGLGFEPFKGESGFKREDLAVTAQLWTENQFIPAPTAKESIALASYLQEEPTPLSAFFLDHTPTPLVNNHLDAMWTDCPVPPCPKPCATGGAKLARLWFAGVPTDGNTDFAFTIDNTRGPVF